MCRLGLYSPVAKYDPANSNESFCLTQGGKLRQQQNDYILRDSSAVSLREHYRAMEDTTEFQYNMDVTVLLYDNEMRYNKRNNEQRRGGVH